MIITPHNYLLSDPSRQSTQQIRIDYTDEEVTDVYTFGSKPAAGQINFVSVSPTSAQSGSKTWQDANLWDPTTYYGDVAVRKFPYDR
jgi:primary-amine oxidase